MSFSHASVAASGGEIGAQDENEIDRIASSLMATYQGEADIIAARKADVLFLAADTAQAAQWLEVFRCLARPGVRGVSSA